MILLLMIIIYNIILNIVNGFKQFEIFKYQIYLFKHMIN